MDKQECRYRTPGVLIILFRFGTNYYDSINDNSIILLLLLSFFTNYDLAFAPMILWLLHDSITDNYSIAEHPAHH